MISDGQIAGEVEYMLAEWQDSSEGVSAFSKRLVALMRASLLKGLMNPSKAAIDAGEAELEDHRDSTTDSREGGSYDYITPGAALAVYRAVLAEITATNPIISQPNSPHNIPTEKEGK